MLDNVMIITWTLTLGACARSIGVVQCVYFCANCYVPYTSKVRICIDLFRVPSEYQWHYCTVTEGCSQDLYQSYIRVSFGGGGGGGGP